MIFSKIKPGDKPSTKPKLMMPHLEHQLKTMQLTRELCSLSPLNKAHAYFQSIADCTKDLQNFSNNQDDPAPKALSDTIMSHIGPSICHWMSTGSNSHHQAYSLQIVAEDL